MFCKNCGHKIGENEKFCSNCGTKLGEKEISSDVNDLTQSRSVSEIDEPVKIKKNNTGKICILSLLGIAAGIVLLVSGLDEKGALFAVGMTIMLISTPVFIISGIKLASRADKSIAEKEAVKNGIIYDKLQKRVESGTQMLICAILLVAAMVMTFMKLFQVDFVMVSLFDLIYYSIGLSTAEIGEVALASDSTRVLSVIAALAYLYAIFAVFSVVVNYYTADPKAEGYPKKINQFWHGVESASVTFIFLYGFFPVVLDSFFDEDHKILKYIIRLNPEGIESTATYVVMVMICLLLFALFKNRNYKKVYG